jgi:hypothetical protein
MLTLAPFNVLVHSRSSGLQMSHLENRSAGFPPVVRHKIFKSTSISFQPVARTVIRA